MCGRTSMAVPTPTVKTRFNLTTVPELDPRYNIAPGDDLPVIQNDNPDTLELAQWGFVPGWVDDPSEWPRPINARAETIAEKPAFRSAFRDRRCLVVADGYYEWQGERGHKQPYRVHRADGAPFAFAGIWDTWKENGSELETVAIITTEPNDVTRSIHDRMPVILEPDDELVWLTEDDPEVLQGVLDPFSPEDTAAYPVSSRVNSPANDDPGVIEPVEIGEQSGLSDFYP